MLTHIQPIVRPNHLTAVTAWIVMLTVSTLPDAALHELTGTIPGWLMWTKMSALVVMVAATFVWHEARPLRNFFIILLAIYAAELALRQLTASTLWQAWFGNRNAAFTLNMFGEQLGRLMVSLMLIGVLLVLRYRRADFFLARGKLDAPIEPVKWLGFPKPDPWTRFGAQWSLYISLGLLVFLIIFGRPIGSSFVQATPMLPATKQIPDRPD